MQHCVRVLFASRTSFQRNQRSTTYSTLRSVDEVYYQYRARIPTRDYPAHVTIQHTCVHRRAHTHSYRVFIVDINVLFTQFLRRLRAFFFSYLKRKVEDQRNRKKDSKEGRKRGKEEEEWGRTNVRVEITIVKNRRARAAGGEGQRERERERVCYR